LKDGYDLHLVRSFLDFIHIKMKIQLMSVRIKKVSFMDMI